MPVGDDKSELHAKVLLLVNSAILVTSRHHPNMFPLIAKVESR